MKYSRRRGGIRKRGNPKLTPIQESGGILLASFHPSRLGVGWPISLHRETSPRVYARYTLTIGWIDRGIEKRERGSVKIKDRSSISNLLDY